MADFKPPVPFPQRNATGREVVVPAIPATVQPGEVVSWPWHLAGFEPVPPEPVPAKAKRPAAAESSDDAKGAGR